METKRNLHKLFSTKDPGDNGSMAKGISVYKFKGNLPEDLEIIATPVAGSPHWGNYPVFLKQRKKGLVSGTYYAEQVTIVEDPVTLKRFKSNFPLLSIDVINYAILRGTGESYLVPMGAFIPELPEMNTLGPLSNQS